MYSGFTALAFCMANLRIIPALYALYHFISLPARVPDKSSQHSWLVFSAAQFDLVHWIFSPGPTGRSPVKAVPLSRIKLTLSAKSPAWEISPSMPRHDRERPAVQAGKLALPREAYGDAFEDTFAKKPKLIPLN